MNYVQHLSLLGCVVVGLWIAWDYRQERRRTTRARRFRQARPEFFFRG